MNYINTETGEDDLNEFQVRTKPEFDNVSFGPDDFPPAPYVERLDTTQPAYNPLTQDVTRAPSAFIDGAWRQVWSVVDVSAEEAAARLATAKAQAWTAIKAHRDSISDTGGYTAAGKWFHSDAKSKTQQLALVIMGANVPAVQWKTMDGTFVTMTQTLAGQIFQAAAAQDMAIFAAAETHRAAMEQSADPLAYDFSGGWPAIYGG